MIIQLFNSPIPYSILTLLCLIGAAISWKMEYNAWFLRSMFVLGAVGNAFVAGVAFP